MLIWTAGAHWCSREDHALRHRWFWLRFLDGPIMEGKSMAAG